MNSLSELSVYQQNILIASILGDGEITKCYKNSRRKNNSYREHFSIAQLSYRQWKQSMLAPLFYMNRQQDTLRSRSLPLFTSLFHDFYDTNGNKVIPSKHLLTCTNPVFLAVLYMDDGSLSISKRINHRLKKVYLVPNIYLYLQSFQYEDLERLQKHIHRYFQFNFTISKRNDGFGHILRFTSTANTYRFLDSIKEITASCPDMYYKTNWSFRFKQETRIHQQRYPNYEVIAASSERSKTYSQQEIKQLIQLKKKGTTDKEIAAYLNRSYWSVVYKLRELRQLHLFK